MGWIVGSLVVLILLLLLFIRSPWGQNIIVQRAVKYVSNKTGTEVAIDKLFITFDGNILLKGLYLEDKKGDTLVYSKKLEADIPLLPLIKGNSIGIDYLSWEGLRANIVRKDSASGYNFQFLMDAFAPSDTTQVAADTTSAPPEIVLGAIHLSDFNVVFNDSVLGIDSQFKVGKLDLEMKKTDLQQMDFRAESAKISNSRIVYHQSTVPPQPESDDVPLPYLQLEDLQLKNVFVDYSSQPDNLTADLEIGDLFLQLEKADLPNNEIVVGDFNLNNSIVQLHTQAKENAIAQTAEEIKEEAEEDIEKFDWPDFRLSADRIDLGGNRIRYWAANQEVKPGRFNANAISLENLHLQANDIYLKDKRAGLNLEELQFQEGSGLNLKQLAVKLEATDQYINLEQLQMALNNNSLKGKVRMEYENLATFIGSPQTSKIAAKFPGFRLNLRDIFRFQPSLRENDYLKALSQKPLSGHLEANGYLSSITIPNLLVNWGGSTRISAHGMVNNATQPDRLAFNLPQFEANTIKEDLTQFVSEKDLGVNLPEDIAIQGQARGNLEDIYADAKITTSQGIASIDGHFRNDGGIAFDADVQIEEYQLNKLLGDDALGTLSLSLKTKGSGSDINSLDATLDATIHNFKFQDYAIEDWDIEGKIKNGEGNISTAYKDHNIDLKLDSEIQLDSIAPQFSVHLNVKGVNLQAIGVMDRDVRTALKLDADFEGNKDGFDVIATIGDGVVVYDDRAYLLGDVLATAHVRSDTTSIWVDNKIVQLSLESNTDPETFATALEKHIDSYFTRKFPNTDTISRPVKLKVIGRVAQAPVLNKVFLVNVKELDTIKLAAYFNEKERQFEARITAPQIVYGSSQLDSLSFAMATDKEKFGFDLKFDRLQADPLAIPQTKLSGQQQGDTLQLAFTAVHNDSVFTRIKSQLSGTAKRLRFHVLPDSLMLNQNHWTVPDNNEMLITPKALLFDNFTFSNGDEQFSLTHQLPNVSRDHAAIRFGNFKLGEILNYLNPEEKLATGSVNGDIAIIQPFGSTGIMADLSINHLNMLNVDLGTLSLRADSKGGNIYTTQLAIKDGAVDLDAEGRYVAGPKEGTLNLDLDLNEVKMEAMEGFSLGEIKNGKGTFSGHFKITGTTAKPKYKGNLHFEDASFTVAKLNAPFTLRSEDLQIKNKGLFLHNFTVLDQNRNELVLSGTIGTENFINPTFDLSIYADDFQVLDASEEDNDFLYGKAMFDANAKLTGDLNIPKLDASITVGNNTDLTYVLPSATVAIEERDGVVIFVNREDPDAVLTRTDEETTTLTGLDIQANLKIAKDAKVNIVIDQETGDHFKVYGDGDFNFSMNPNGQMALSGLYEIAGGHYEMNLYNLVNRRFDLVSGSRVSWNGDPFDAKLDIKAVYKVEASASALMAPISSGADPAVKGKYRQVLPFYVYLNVDGELEKPKISFDLDMPEGEQGAIGGQVYGRIQQVNQQEGELNRQVFSLLVLNRFYPEPGSDGSRGGFASVARDNLNDAISDQLNVFSDKLLGKTGVELDFGLDSYTDYQGETPQERTQLDIAAQKKLFDDRLIVRVGSEVDLQGSSSTNEPTPLIGNVSLEYLLTENGRYRLKGFRRNEYENVIDGQTIVSGIALIFTQEFNKFDELWDALLHGVTEKEKNDRQKAKEKEKKKKERLEAEKMEKPYNDLKNESPDNKENESE